MEQAINIKTSEQISEIVSALAKAQSKMKPAVFNRVNPHFKTRYADFTSCMEACRGPLSENGIAIVQSCQTIDGKLNLVTLLAHTSGQWMTSEFPLISAKLDSQGIGSAMTYAKRYSLCGMVGIVADEEGDDDGEAAVGRPLAQAAKPPVNEFKTDKAPAPANFNRVSPQQLATLKGLEGKLDNECKAKINTWLKNQYNIVDYVNIPADIFQKVFGALENAVKFMEQNQKQELVGVA